MLDTNKKVWKTSSPSGCLCVALANDNLFSAENKEYSIQRLLLGTHTSGDEQNHLMIAEVRLPLEEAAIDPRKYDDQTGGMLTLSPTTPFFPSLVI